MVRVLFVCTGNICRSPTAEGVFRALVEAEGLADRIEIDSAGTHAYHVGESPDPRSQAAAKRRGIDLSAIRGRKVTVKDFETFDYVLAMDRTNLQILKRLRPRDAHARLQMMLDFVPDGDEKDVPDPYYGAGDGFERVLNLIEAASQRLLGEIQRSRLGA